MAGMIHQGFSALEVSTRHRNRLVSVDFSPSMCAFLSQQHSATPHLLEKRIRCRPEISCSSNFRAGPHLSRKYRSSRNLLPFLRWTSLQTGLMSSDRLARFNPSPSNLVTHSMVHEEFSEVTTLSAASHPPIQPEEIVKLFFFLTDHVKDVNINAVISFVIAIALVGVPATYFLKQRRRSNNQQIRGSGSPSISKVAESSQLSSSQQSGESSSPSTSKVAENKQSSNSHQSRESSSPGASKVAENVQPSTGEKTLSNSLLENDDWRNFSKLSPFNRTVAARCPSLRFAAAETYIQRGNLNEPEYQRRCLVAADGGTVALDWPAHLELDGSEELRTVVLLVLGTSEGSQGPGIGGFAKLAEQYGCFPVIFNPRGCGGSPVTTPRVFSAADSDDVRLAANFLSRSRPWATMFSVGWGLGANLLTNYLAVEGRSTPVTAAVCIDNPFDISVAVRSQSSSRWLAFDRAVTKGIVQVLAENKMLFRGKKNAIDVQGALAATSLYEFDKAVSRVVHGFSTVEDFYRNSSSVSSLEEVQVPILCIQHTEDYMSTNVPIPRYAFERNAYTMLLVSQLPGIGSDSAAFERAHLISLEWLAAVEVSLLKGHHPLSRDFSSRVWLGKKPSIEDSNVPVTGTVSKSKTSESEPKPGPPDKQPSQQTLRPIFEGRELAERMEAGNDGLESSRAAGRANGSVMSEPADETVIAEAPDTQNASITRSTKTSATQNGVSLDQEAAVKNQEDHSKKDKSVSSIAPDDGNEGLEAEALVQRKNVAKSEAQESERAIDTGALQEAHDQERSSTETQQKDGPNESSVTDSVRRKESKNLSDHDSEGKSKEQKQEPEPEREPEPELTEEEAAERGEILQVAETVMKVMDVTMPGALSPSKKDQVLKAVGSGETLVTALEGAVPEDVRGKISGAVAEIVDGKGISLKLPQLGRNLPQMTLPEGLSGNFQSEVASLTGKGDGQNSNQPSSPSTPPVPNDASDNNKSPTPTPASQPKSDSSSPSDSTPTPSSTSANSTPRSESPPDPASQKSSAQPDSTSSPSQNESSTAASKSPASSPQDSAPQNSSQPPAAAQDASKNANPPPAAAQDASKNANPPPAAAQDASKNANPPPAAAQDASKNANPPPAPQSPAPQNASPPPPPSSPPPPPQGSAPPPPNPAPQNANPPPPAPSPAPPPPAAAPPSPAPPGPAPPIPAPQFPSMGDALTALTGFDDSTQMAVTNVFGVMEGVLDQLEQDNPSIDPQTSDPKHRQEIIDKADAEVTRKLENCTPGVVGDSSEVNEDEGNTGDHEKQTVALDRANEENNTHSMSGNGKGTEDGLTLNRSEPANEPADTGGNGAVASGNGSVKQPEQRDQQGQPPSGTSGRHQTETKTDTEGSQSNSKLTTPPSGNSPSSNGSTKLTKGQEVADNSVSKDSANQEQLNAMAKEIEAGGNSSEEFSGEKIVADNHSEENKPQDNKKSGLVTSLVVNALQLEVVRRIGAAGLEAVGVDLEQEATKVAAAVSGTLSNQKAGLLEKFSTGLKDSEEGSDGKLGVLNGDAVLSALNSVFGKDSMLGGLIPVGVLVGVVMAALGAVYLIITEDEEKESAHVQGGDPDSGHRSNGTLRPKSGTFDEASEEQSSGNGNGAVRAEETDGEDIVDEDVEGNGKGLQNGKMAGAVAAAMGASAAVASQSGSSMDNSSHGKPKVPEIAEKALSVVSPVVPKTEDGKVDQDRMVALLTEIGQRGGPLLLVGKAALLWGGLNGAMSFADRLLSFLRMSERPLPQRLLGFGAMALLLWTPVLIPLLPNLLQNWVTGTPSGVAEAAGGVGLYGAVFIMITIWGKRVRGYKRPLVAYGLELFSRARLRMFAGGIAIGFSLVSAYYGVNWGLGYSQITWESIVVENPAFPGSLASVVLTSWKLLMLVGQSLSMAVAVSLVEEVLFRSWLQEELTADLGYDWAVLLSALAFAVVHWSPQALVGLWFLGVAFAGARARTEGHLTLPVGIHTGIVTAFSVMNTGNLVQFTADSPAWFTGANVGNPLAGALGTGIAAALAIALYPHQPYRLPEEAYEGFGENIEGTEGELPDGSAGNGAADVSPRDQAGSESQNGSQNGSPTINESESGSQAASESESVV